MQTIDYKKMMRQIQFALSGAHMLAFLPAMCLAAYWLGGETTLVTFALLLPLLYAATGGFSSFAGAPLNPVSAPPDMKAVAQDFLDIAHHNGQTTACIQVGVSGLDEIARTLGDTVAQEARQAIAARLTSTLRGSDHVFATGESRFTVFIAPGFRLKLDGLLDLSKRLRAAVEEPLSVSATTQFLFASMGIASSLNFGRNITPDSWIASANQALGEAARHGPSSTRVWSEKLSQSCAAQQILLEDLQDAFAKGQIQAFFQPQVSLGSGDLVGMEVLARWDHPTRGVIAPAEFFRALHDSGDMEELGKTMLQQTLLTLAQWDALGLHVPCASINLSELELRNPNLVEHITQTLDCSGFATTRFAFEISEAVIAKGPDDIAIRNVTALSDLGCWIDLDNFGTGRTSIGALQHLPIRTLKIDQSLVRNIHTSETKARLFNAILALADQLDLKTLAEGVETVNEEGVLREAGCGYAQGFLFAKPMSASDCASGLGARHAKQASEMGAQQRLQ